MKEYDHPCVDTHKATDPTVSCNEVSVMPDYSIIPDEERETIKLTFEHHINELLYAKGIISQAMYETVKKDLEESMMRGESCHEE